MPRVLKIALLLIYATLVYSCAKQNNSGPTGGPIDETPPVVVEADPPNKTINFSSSAFEITFDEYFVLDNINDKLMTSPPFDKKPEVKTKGKTMIVNFEEELRDSVTYTFYFLDAIRDLNENNPMENFQYVFSTGPSIDSLSVTGTIYDAKTLDPLQDVFVVLYANHHDTIPKTTLPAYITRATEEGKFRIDNIAHGEYSIYGLVDLNRNKFYDLPDESFAFIDSTLTLSSANNFIGEMPDSLASAADSARYDKIPGREYELLVFTGENKEQYLLSSDREEAYKLMYVFKQPLDSGQFDLKFIDQEEVSYIQESSSNNDTILVWLLDSLFYSNQTINTLTSYPRSDSTGQIEIKSDTISFRYVQPRVTRGRGKETSIALPIRHNAGDRKGFKPGQDLSFSFSTPIEDPDKDLLNLFMSVDTILLPLQYNIRRDSSSNKRLILEHEFIEDSTYIAIINKGTFKDIYGNLNDSTAIRIKVRNNESYGTLTINVSGYLGKIIMQLLEDGEKLIREDYLDITDVETVYYPLLEKGEYTLKAIFDLNGDQEWTTGDYDLKRKPEPVTYYPSVMEVKVQWDLIQDWEISGINQKDNSLRKSGSSSRTR